MRNPGMKMSTNDATTTKPLPTGLPEAEAFRRAAKHGKLLYQFCPACHGRILFPRICCPHCLALDLEWRQAGGRGRIYSFTVIRQAARPCFAADVPYVYAIVELDEGPRLLTNIVGIAPDAVTVDMPVRVVFEQPTPEIGIPKFAPALNE